MRLRRDDAIETIARAEARAMTADERAERLDLIELEDWDDDPIWRRMPRDLRRELRRAELRDEPNLRAVR